MKSPIRLNQNHSYTVFRVFVAGLKPQRTYYYTVDSIQGNGKSDRVKSTVAHFTNRHIREASSPMAANAKRFWILSMRFTFLPGTIRCCYT